MTSENYHKWNTLDWIKWKAYAGDDYLWEYKDAWVIFHRDRIIRIAKQHAISPELLAGVAWEEAGGKPEEIRKPWFFLRAFDWSGPDWVDRNLTVMHHPTRTSLGVVSIQLRTFADDRGLDATKLSHEQQLDIIRCLESDPCNLEAVAVHLQRLIKHDFPELKNTETLTDEQFIIVGSRYNRGTERVLADFQQSIKADKDTPLRTYTDYGRAMLRRRPRIRRLLGGCKWIAPARTHY